MPKIFFCEQEKMDPEQAVIKDILLKEGFRVSNIVAQKRCVTTHFIADTDRGKFVLRLYPKRWQDAKLETGNVEFEVKVLHHFASKGISAPIPLIFSSNQKSILEFGETKIFAYPFLKGKCLEKEKLSRETAYKAGELLQQMIEGAKDFVPSSDAPTGDIEYIQQIAAKRQEEYLVLKRSQEYQKMCRFAQESKKMKQKLAATPLGIVHADFFYENILQEETGKCHIIDFADAYYGRVVMDVVTGSMEFCVLQDEWWDMDLLEAFLEPLAPWLAKGKIDFNLFYDLFLINCLRFAVYTLPKTLADDKPIENNPYIRRFFQLQKASLKKRICDSFRKISST